MDRLIYITMTGAKQSMLRQAAIANNLANVSTTGFKADQQVFRALPVVGGSGQPTRAFVADTTAASDLSQGTLRSTGREMDVAINGRGWFAVQTPTGEAYMRSNSLQVDSNGVLRTTSGYAVLGDGGPITVPAADNQLLIGRDGTISAVPLSGSRASGSVVGQMKLVNPADKDLIKGPDNLFHLRSSQPAPAATDVSVATGMLEESNVNATSALIDMISVQRQYDMQMKLMTTVSQNSAAAEQLISLTS